MSIKKYKNFDKIDQKGTNEGKFIEDKDFVIVTKGEVEEADFGDCAYDVMEVSVYDINNNLLPNKTGDSIAYIKSGNIKHYLYNVTNKGGQKELAIDIEKILKDLGFHNGILRTNINFVRSRVGNENEMRRVWIQEISPSKNEIRILPLKTADTNISNLNTNDLNNLKNLNKDFKYYKRSILDSLTSIEKNVLDSINSALETKFGKDFFNTIKNDFGIKDFNVFRTKIYSDFKESVTNYLSNRYYDIRESNFSKQAETRFIDCEQYEFSMIIGEMEKILFNCIEYNSYFLKRRSILIKEVPTEFKVVELTKNVQNNLNEFATQTKPATLVYPAPTPTPPIFPQNISIPTSKSNFEYTIRNFSSKNTIIVKFVDVTGTEVQKSIAMGKTITVCAQDGSVSANNIQNRVQADDTPQGLASKTAQYPAVDWEFTKTKACNTLDVSEMAPTPSPVTVATPKVITQTPPVVTTTPTPHVVTTTPSSTTSTGGCFVEGTLVTLANGAKIAIEEVVTGMEVLTWNEQSGQQEAGIVTDLIRPISSDIISIELNNESIECTTDHPLFVVGKGWASYNPVKTKEVHQMEVAELVDGDLVLNTSDEAVAIYSISPIITLVPIQTYNLTIEGNHTYYANGILVHNKLATPVSNGGSGAGGGVSMPGGELDNQQQQYGGMPVRGGSTSGGPRNTTAYLTTGGGE